MMKSFHLLVFVLSLLTVDVVGADEGIAFRYKAARQAPLIYQTSSKMEQSQSAGGQSSAATIRQTTIGEWTFESTDAEGNQQWRRETKRLKVDLRIEPVGEYAYDSTAEAAETGSILSEALKPVYDRLATAAATVTISPLGEVKSVGGVTELLSDLLKNHPLGAKLAGGDNDEAARLNMAEYFIVFSEEPVKQGDSWDVEFEMTLPGIGKLTGKRTYRYVGPDKVGETATAKFSVEFDVSIEVDLKTNGTELSGTLSTSDAAGTVQFDPEQGRIVSASNKYTVGGDINIARNNETQKITTSQTQTVEHRLLEKLPE